ncbi:MAG: FAD-dependent monooxygenase, partial [Pseudonocardiaceae bacterium]
RAFTRFYRLRSPGVLPGPLNRGNAAGGIWDHYAAVAHPCDNGTFAVTLGVSTADRATTALSRPGPFTAAACLSPYLAPWTDAKTAVPFTGVRPITMPPNILRPTAGPGQRPVAGLFPVGDAVCVTDPLLGRGMSLALLHAFRLADLLDAHPAVGEQQSERAAQLADELFRPWYEQAVHDGVVRDRLWRARAAGIAPPPPASAVTGRPTPAAVAAAAMTDATVWRGVTRFLMSLTAPAEIFDDAAFRDRVRAAPADDAPAGPRSPTRTELLQAIAAAEGAR